ncbi:MAG: serine--tRNA ligase [Albidovulum sp.]|nr:serine--tRNA ligase [Albidovulum sp.]MDE0307132.1 serine--tRNA ligase [Albidovulum sp.]
MHDIRRIRDRPKEFDSALARRGFEPVARAVLKIDTERRKKIRSAEIAQAERNAASSAIGKAKSIGDQAEFERLRSVVAGKRAEISTLEDEASAANAELEEFLLGIPNLPASDVPDGDDESSNLEIRSWGKPRTLDFEPAPHHEILAVRKGMDLETAAKISGTRFMLLSGAIAKLHRALAQFMIDIQVEENGLTEVWVPVLVREETMVGTGQLPKFAHDSYRTTEGHWLVPTAEVPLTNIVGGRIVDESYLPRRFCAHTQCFRSEAGAAGRDTAGMLRQHQFEKVEMVSVTTPDESKAELSRMTRCAESILERLEIPYRTVVLCTGDMGFSAMKTHDVEVWLPGQGAYREISSVSVCGDFQARRMNARFRPASGGPVEFVHTLNGSGLAVGRTLIAVLENGQRADGSVQLPSSLASYLGGKRAILPSGDFA